MYIDDYGKLKMYYPSDLKLWLMIFIDKISHNRARKSRVCLA